MIHHVCVLGCHVWQPFFRRGGAKRMLVEVPSGEIQQVMRCG
jgi:hypothetical protein